MKGELFFIGEGLVFSGEASSFMDEGRSQKYAKRSISWGVFARGSYLHAVFGEKVPVSAKSALVMSSEMLRHPVEIHFSTPNFTGEDKNGIFAHW